MKLIINYLKKTIKKIFIHINYLIGNQYIPEITNNINIETTSKCNLKCKFCAYDKRDTDLYPLETMSQITFEKIVNQSIELGYQNFGLTPVTGDVFMDKNFFTKINFLEKVKNFSSYYFFTNFIPLNKEKIDKILKLKKLKNFGISIYGHDEDTFIKFSKGNEISYLKLIENLEYLLNKIKSIDLKFNIEIFHRTEKNYILANNKSKVSKIINELILNKNINYQSTYKFNNWGGMISKKDVEGLNIDMYEEKDVKKYGSCSLIYSRMIVGANGIVNACACRDANYSLRIGNINEKPLKEIISLKNKKYKEIIERQEKNDFPEVCKTCDFYKSIYTINNPIWAFKTKNNKFLNLKKVRDILEKRS